MPLNIPDDLPAGEILAREDIFLMNRSRAVHQDIRPQHILLLNLMPKKIETETHFIRLLSNSPLQVELELLHIEEHVSTNTPAQHIETFYRNFREIKKKKYDGMIITGAPLGKIPFEEVSYWPHLQEIMDWAESHVTSTVYVCWAALAACWHFYNLPKITRKEKRFGVFEHRIVRPHHPLLRGGDDVFWAPHSRNGDIDPKHIHENDDLIMIAESEEVGPYLWTSIDHRKIFVLGHAEYDPQCLQNEYERDIQAGLDIKPPKNYYPDDNPSQSPLIRWRSHGNLMFSNWLNYFVYQMTPYDRKNITK